MTEREARIRAEAMADTWLAFMRGQARRAMREGGATDSEIAAFMHDHYEQQLADWRVDYLARLRRERQEIAEAGFHLDALEAWEPTAGDGVH